MSNLPRPQRSGIPPPSAGSRTPAARGPSATGLTPRPSGSRLAAPRAVSSGYGRVSPSAPTLRATPSAAPPRASPSGYGLTTARSSTSRTKDVVSKTKVTVTKPTGAQGSAVTADRGVRKTASGTAMKVGAPIGARKSQAAVPIPPPSILRKQVALQVKGAAAKAPMGSRVTAVAAKKTRVPPLEKITTPAGPQQVIQKVITEKRVERSKHGETVARNIKTIQMNPRTGEATQVEEEIQTLNPDFAVEEGPVKEIVTVVSERDITTSYKSTTQNVIHETTKLETEVGMDPQQVSRLVEEENEDVQNALRINPPDLVTQAPDKYPLKKRLHALRLSPENVALLEKSVIQPPISADEPLPEATPELLAKVMNAMDKSMEPKMDPEATFNTLFTEASAMEPSYAMMNISSAAPGPLGDVVVPNEATPEVVQEEMLSQQMEEASLIVETAPEKPADNSFSVKAPVEPKKKEKKKRPKFKPLTDEDPPWGKEDLPDVSIAVGALPKENLDTTDMFETTQSGNISTEVDKGIEYYLDCNPLQYISRVQLRGSQPPTWFPGYVYALSDMSDGVEVAKSPSQVMFAAWKSVQPKIFPDDSIVYN